MHTGPPFIGPPIGSESGKPCLVLDLDETLVHSSFKPVPNADYIIPVEIDPGTLTDVYVLKRPFVDYFMEDDGQALRDCRVHGESGEVRRSAVGSVWTFITSSGGGCSARAATRSRVTTSRT
jgi:hypothetical protein